MRLRPHHLLCTQGYSGKGYNDEFIKNMDDITNIIRKNKNTIINLIFSTDDICKCCPNMISEDLCITNEKVKSIDNKIIKYFSLEEKEYIYNEIVDFIKNNITEEIMDDICCECEWYPISSCKKKILDK